MNHTGLTEMHMTKAGTLTWICCRWLWELKFSEEEGSDMPADTAVAWVRTPVPSMVSGSWEELDEEVVVVGT